MKFYVLILSAAILLYSCNNTTPQKPKAEPPAKPAVAKNQNMVPLIKSINHTEYPVFKIMFPEVWENTLTNHPSVYITIRDPEMISDAGDFFTNLYVSNMLYSATTVEELVAIYENDFASHFQNLTVLNSGSQKINNENYVWIEFNYVYQGHNIKGIEYWLEDPNNPGESFIISGKTLTNRYHYYKPIFLDIINSVEFDF